MVSPLVIYNDDGLLISFYFTLGCEMREAINEKTSSGSFPEEVK
jgi:hypothetical protein